MHASTKRRPHQSYVAATAIARAEEPSRHWALVLIAACTASWVTIIGTLKLLLAFV